MAEDCSKDVTLPGESCKCARTPPRAYRPTAGNLIHNTPPVFLLEIF